MKLEDLVDLAPMALHRILECLPPDSLQAMLATSSRLCHEVCYFVTAVSIRGKPVTQRLLNLPLSRIRRFSNLCAFVRSEDIVGIARANWHLLDSLQLHLFMSSEQLELLLSNMRKPNLQHLDLSNNTWSPASMSVLVDSHWSVGITQLALCGALLDVAAIVELVKGNLPVLSVLRLDDNALGSLAMSHLSRGIWPQLRHLSLRENKLNECAMRRLLQGRWPLVQHVDLFHNNLGSGGVRALGEGSWVNMQFLDVGRNLCGAEGLSGLAEGKWPLLRELRVSEAICDMGALVTSPGGNWPLLEKLDLSGKLLSNQIVNLLFDVDIHELVHRQSTCDGELLISGWSVHGRWPSLRSVTLTALLYPRMLPRRLTVNCM